MTSDEYQRLRAQIEKLQVDFRIIERLENTKAQFAALSAMAKSDCQMVQLTIYTNGSHGGQFIYSVSRDHLIFPKVMEELATALKSIAGTNNKILEKL